MTTRRVGNQSGNLRGSTAASINCSNTKTPTAYAPTVRSTFRRFNSASVADMKD